jgi:hypothetical protein
MLTTMKIKKYIAVCTATFLSFGVLIGIPFKAYVKQMQYNPKCIEFSTKLWTKSMAKAYAVGYMRIHYPKWGRAEERALMKLWGKESAWNHEADNPHSSAYGIAQVLGTKPGTPAPLQIERGLEYIVHRYDKPSIAWSHHRKKGWY